MFVSSSDEICSCECLLTITCLSQVSDEICSCECFSPSHVCLKFTWDLFLWVLLTITCLYQVHMRFVPVSVYHHHMFASSSHEVVPVSASQHHMFVSSSHEICSCECCWPSHVCLKFRWDLFLEYCSLSHVCIKFGWDLFLWVLFIITCLSQDHLRFVPRSFVHHHMCVSSSDEICSCECFSPSHVCLKFTWDWTNSKPVESALILPAITVKHRHKTHNFLIFVNSLLKFMAIHTYR